MLPRKSRDAIPATGYGDPICLMVFAHPACRLPAGKSLHSPSPAAGLIVHPDPGIQGQEARLPRKDPHRIEVHLPQPGKLHHQLG